jgi:hypothetical protein
MPPDLPDVAAIVVILGAPEIVNAKLARCAELGRIEPRASLHGNIAVKPLPIRLLALCPLGSGNPKV